MSEIGLLSPDGRCKTFDAAANGFVRGEGTIDLEPDGDATRVKWTGDMQIGGLIAGVGQRMLGGVGKMLIGQFFKCLEQRLGPGA